MTFVFTMERRRTSEPPGTVAGIRDRKGMVMATGVQVVFDAADPDRLARFWAAALHYVPQPPPQGYDSWPEFLARSGVPESQWGSASAVIDPAGAGPRLYFQRVPEPKTAKNRVHLDINISSRAVPIDQRRPVVDAESERLLGAGATRLYVQEEGDQYTVTMADPEGNEFCVH